MRKKALILVVLLSTLLSHSLIPKLVESNEDHIQKVYEYIQELRDLVEKPFGRERFNERQRIQSDIKSMGDDAIPGLTKAVREGNVDIRGEALSIIGSLREEAVWAIPVLIERLHWDYTLHHYVIDTLGYIGEKAIPALLEALNHEVYSVRIGAVQALRNIGPPAKEAISMLIEALPKEEYINNLYYTLDALEVIGVGGLENVEPFLALINDEKYQKYYDTIARILGQVGPNAETAIPRLLELTSEKDEKIRINSIWALGHIKLTPEVESKLLQLAVANDTEAVRARAIASLGSLNIMSDEVYEIVKDAKQDPDENVRSLAEVYLLKFDNPKEYEKREQQMIDLWGYDMFDYF